MALVSYSVSTSDESEEDSASSSSSGDGGSLATEVVAVVGTSDPARAAAGSEDAGRRTLLPAPELEADKAAISDAHVLGKRKRTFEHVDGNWATVLLIPGA